LDHQPPSSSLKVSKLSKPSRVVVEMPTSPGVREKVSITEGITWLREDTFLAGRWTRLNQLLFNPQDPNLQVVVGLAKEKTDAREALTAMVDRYGAVAGINGGFFAGKGGALGLVYRDGRMLVPHVSRRPPRSGFGLTETGEALFGRIAAAGAQIKDLDGGDWSKAHIALGGGPRLIKAGVAKITADLEELGPKGNDITRVAARTVVGLTKGGQLMFATVTGYSDNHKEGSQFGPLVTWLKGLGVQDAVNFDGGASVNMVIGSHIVSDGPRNRSREKPVATALLVKDKRERLYPDKAQWNFEKTSLPADGASRCHLSVSLTTPTGKKVPDGTEVRISARGVTVEPTTAVTSGGEIKVNVQSIRVPGKAKIEVLAGPLSEVKTFELERGVAETLHFVTTGAKAMDDDDSFQKVTVKIQSVDKWGNAVPAQEVRCSLDGSEVVPFKTDQLGMLALDLELSLNGGVFTVNHPTVGERTFQIPPLSQRTSRRDLGD